MADNLGVSELFGAPLTVSLRVLGLVVLASCGGLQAQLTLTCAQPSGDGSFSLSVTGASPNAELFNLISLSPVSPTGSGPFFGLGLGGSALLLTQILSPLGTVPYHVLADGSGAYLWSFANPPGSPIVTIPADVVTIQWSTAAGYGGHSPVFYIEARF